MGVMVWCTSRKPRSRPTYSNHETITTCLHGSRSLPRAPHDVLVPSGSQVHDSAPLRPPPRRGDGVRPGRADPGRGPVLAAAAHDGGVDPDRPDAAHGG